MTTAGTAVGGVDAMAGAVREALSSALVGAISTASTPPTLVPAVAESAAGLLRSTAIINRRAYAHTEVGATVAHIRSENACCAIC